jgi:nucleotide-binding universal stress UspA family protein
MQGFKNILFLSNPDIDQHAALSRARSLARQPGARIALMSVVKELPDNLEMAVPATTPEALQASVVADHRAQTQALAKDLSNEGVEARALVAVGTQFVEVIREVLRSQHDLVVLAADSRLNLKDRLFGSTSMHLMRKCPCPVWVVKRGAAGACRRILVAVDTGGDAFQSRKRSLNPMLLQLGSALARADNSELHVVQAWSVVHEGYLQVRAGLGDAGIRKLREHTKRDYARKLGLLLRDAGLDGFPHLVTHLKRGEPAEVITRLATELETDLLVMGTVCRTGLAGLLIGNTAEEVLGAVDCSVLTIKPEGFVSPVTLQGA